MLINFFFKYILKLQQIDEITIRSSFFNSEVSKLLSITIRDIRINKDINEANAADGASDRTSEDNSTEPNLNVCDFRNKKVPPSIIKFAQVNFFSLQIPHKEHFHPVMFFN